jgi:predicted nucleic acid-binding protein
MAFVVDASVAAAWLLPHEVSDVAAAAYTRLPEEEAVAPGLWWLEIRNIFLNNEQRGHINTAKSNQALDLLAGLPIRLDHRAEGDVLMALARKHGLSAYDAAYLELALREALPLATLDDALAKAALAEGVRLVGAT